MPRLLLIVCLASLIGVVMVLILLVPFLGAFTVGLLTVPMCMLPLAALKPYCQNSEYVTFGFAWITIHSPSAYVVYWAEYAFLAFAWLVVRDRRQPPALQRESSTAAAASAAAIHEAMSQHRAGSEVIAKCPSCRATISVVTTGSDSGLVSLSCRCGACGGKYEYSNAEA